MQLLRRVHVSVVVMILMGSFWPAVAISAAPPVTVLVRSTPDAVGVVKNGQKVSVSRQMLKAVLRDGEHETYINVVMLLEPSTGLHWWGYQGTTKDADNFREFDLPFAIYFTDQRSVGFRFAHTVVVREVVGRQHDFASLERSIVADFADHLTSMTTVDGSPHIIEVDVRERLGDFLLKRNSAVSPPPEIVGISRDDNLWHVTLQGPNMDFAEVVLDERYKLERLSFFPKR